MAATEEKAQSTWWGRFKLGEGELGRWRLGPLDLWIRRTALDWRYGATQSDDYLESTLEVQVPAPDLRSGGALPEETARFGFSRTEASLELQPALADRPVVARPLVPFHVPPRQTIEVYVSTPLWVRLRAGGSDLVEVPCSRPSDTWFGSNTSGKLSYATRTHVRRNLENVPLRAHRAISCVTLENQWEKPLSILRLSLPVPQLSLFASPSGTLWTERITLKNDSDGDQAEVSLGKGAPRAAGGGKRCADPRAPQGRSFGSLVFGGLLSAGP